jgi:trk system potassium uptake protein TrkH
MHKSAVAYAIGKLLQVMGLVLIVPLAIAIYDYQGDSATAILTNPDVVGFMIAIITALVSGSVCVYSFRKGRDLQGVKEGFAVVAIGWVALTLVSSIPMTLYLMSQPDIAAHGFFTAFTNGFFEIMSGFTTTGATILTDIEAVPDSLLFLRSMTQWLGGMGIITLAIAIFPAMGVSGYQMFRSEVPGPTKEKLQPRLAQTVSVLWGVYVLLSVIETMLLMVGGMSLFEAVCHTFSTMATGGFSTRNGSIAAFDSPFIEWVIIIFMFLAGINFLLHFRVFRGDFKSLTKNPEFKFYAGVILTAIVVFTAVLTFQGMSPIETAAESYRFSQPDDSEFALHYLEQQERISGFGTVFRTSVFQVVTIVTGTGFVTADFDLWDDFLRAALVFLMFFGGCAGSTTGGLKMIRVMVLAKTAFNELRKMAQPRLVSPVKVGNQVVEEKRVSNIAAFFIFFLGLFILCGILMTLFVPDVETAFTASIAAIGNIGPGLAGVGAAENYAWLPIPAKWLLVITMLLGRLEIFTVLILLRARTWRK